MSKELSLFEENFYQQGSQEIDDTEIKMTLLYYNMEEYKEFKKLAKKAIEDHYGKDKFKDGNLSDILLIILRREYGTENTDAQTALNF